MLLHAQRILSISLILIDGSDDANLTEELEARITDVVEYALANRFGARRRAPGVRVGRSPQASARRVMDDRAGILLDGLLGKEVLYEQ